MLYFQGRELLLNYASIKENVILWGPRTAVVFLVVPVGNVQVLLWVASHVGLAVSRPFSHQCCNKSRRPPHHLCHTGPWYIGFHHTLQTDQHIITIYHQHYIILICIYTVTHTAFYWSIFQSATDLISPLILLFFLLLGWPLQKSPDSLPFQIGLGWCLAILFFTYTHIDWQCQSSDMTSQFPGGGHNIVAIMKKPKDMLFQIGSGWKLAGIFFM